jgi:hypothetical protein
MSSAGEVRWKAPTIPIDTFNAQLRMTSDGALYYNTLGELGWVPLVTPDGRPVPLAEQRRRASALQPMPGGLRLATADVSEHQKEFSLLDRSGHIVRAWRVTSKTTLWLTLTTASMLGRDLVVALDVTRETDSKYLFEHLILRLGSAGGIRAFLALDPHAISDVDAPITEVRLGPDGRFYQLRESPETGVSIARYSLEPRPVAAPQPGPSTAGAPPAPAPTATQPTPIPTTVQATPMSSGSEDTMAEAPARAGDGRSSRSLSVLQMLVPMGACGVVVAWLYGSRRRRGRSTPPSST